MARSFVQLPWQRYLLRYQVGSIESLASALPWLYVIFFCKFCYYQATPGPKAESAVYRTLQFSHTFYTLYLAWLRGRVLRNLFSVQDAVSFYVSSNDKRITPRLHVILNRRKIAWQRGQKWNSTLRSGLIMEELPTRSAETTNNTTLALPMRHS